MKKMDKDKLTAILSDMVDYAEPLGCDENGEPGFYLRKLKAHIERLWAEASKGDVYGVALAAMDAHYYFDKIVFQRDELERKAIQAEQSPKTARDEKTRKAEQRADEIKTAVRKRMKDHPRDSLTYARERVAEEFEAQGKGKGYSLTSVRRAMKGMDDFTEVTASPTLDNDSLFGGRFQAAAVDEGPRLSRDCTQKKQRR